MKTENPLELLRELKGAPLSVLLALALVKQPVQIVWIESVTGYTDDTIVKALRTLTEFNYAVRIGRESWQIATTIQLPFIPEALPEPDKKLNPKISDLKPSTTTDININHSNNLRAVVVPEKIGVYDRLKSIGVGEPNRSRLANMEHITLDYLNAHYEHWKLENKPLGLLIHRLRSCDPAPKRINQDDYRRYTKGRFGKYGIR